MPLLEAPNSVPKTTFTAQNVTLAVTLGTQGKVPPNEFVKRIRPLQLASGQEMKHIVNVS